MKAIGLGYDPGSDAGGYALLEFGGPRPRWLEAGEIEPYFVDTLLEELILRYAHQCAVFVTIEKPTGRVIEGRGGGAQLIDAAWAGGIAYGQLQGVQHNGIVTVSHTQWVTALLGAFSRGKQDPKVKTALSRIVEGFPKQSNTHERDAAGAVLCGYQIWLRGQRMGQRRTG